MITLTTMKASGLDLILLEIKKLRVGMMSWSHQLGPHGSLCIGTRAQLHEELKGREGLRENFRAIITRLLSLR
jgi:hypothetical protein